MKQSSGFWRRPSTLHDKLVNPEIMRIIYASTLFVYFPWLMYNCTTNDKITDYVLFLIYKPLASGPILKQKKQKNNIWKLKRFHVF